VLELRATPRLNFLKNLPQNFLHISHFPIRSDALNDANTILKSLRDPFNSKALTLKADALYSMGDFEHALFNYHRALKSSNSRVSGCQANYVCTYVLSSRTYM
jgi:predicted negative regulator of RcsB-dependent stress response